MIKIVTKGNFEYFLDLLEEKVKSGELDIDGVLKTLHEFNDKFFYSDEAWVNHYRQTEMDMRNSRRWFEKERDRRLREAGFND